jgi:hypothetical protein
MDAETLTPMADLGPRWGVTANTVSRRLAFLGIKPTRQGNFRFLTADQLNLAEELNAHILSGKPQESFPRPDQPEGGLVARRAPQVEQVAGLVAGDQVAALAAALERLNPPAVDPLRLARALAEAADLGVPLSNQELAGVTGFSAGTVSGWKDGHCPRPGFSLRREKAGAAVWWTVERVTSSQPRALPSTSHGTSRQVGFGSIVDASYRVIEGPSLPGFIC